MNIPGNRPSTSSDPNQFPPNPHAISRWIRQGVEMLSKTNIIQESAITKVRDVVERAFPVNQEPTQHPIQREKSTPRERTPPPSSTKTELPIELVQQLIKSPLELKNVPELKILPVPLQETIRLTKINQPSQAVEETISLIPQLETPLLERSSLEMSKGRELFNDGIISSISKKFDSILIFEPDDPKKISREKRAEIVIEASLIAPKQPINRSFEYVAFGSGAMRQDLHQIMTLIGLGINDLNISLIDARYGGIYRDDIPISGGDPSLLKNEIEEIGHTIAPHVKINITLFPSTEEYLEQFSNKKIDLLTAIRVEDHESDIADALERLENKMADDSGMLICSASDNTIKTKCFRKKRERSILPPKHLELNEGSPEMLFLKELNEFKGLLIGSNMGQQRSKNRLISKGWVKNHP